MPGEVIKSLIPNSDEIRALKELGATLVASQLLPATVNTPEKAIAIMLKGKEIGIPPMQAFSSISIIQGKPTMSAELMLALIYRNLPGSVIDIDPTNEHECIIKAQRPHEKKSSLFSFTIKDAEKAGLLSKEGWKKYPAAMLRARCISAMARAKFPDALMGISYTPEEMGAEIEEFVEIKTVEKPREDQTTLDMIAADLPPNAEIKFKTPAIKPDELFSKRGKELGYTEGQLNGFVRKLFPLVQTRQNLTLDQVTKLIDHMVDTQK